MIPCFDSRKAPSSPFNPKAWPELAAASKNRKAPTGDRSPLTGSDAKGHHKVNRIVAGVISNRADVVFPVCAPDARCGKPVGRLAAAAGRRRCGAGRGAAGTPDG
jgi:hypothetical protein